MDRILQLFAISTASIILYFIRDSPQNFIDKFVESLNTCQHRLRYMEQKPALFILFMQQSFPQGNKGSGELSKNAQKLERTLYRKFKLNISDFFSTIEAYDVPDFEKEDKKHRYDQSLHQIRKRCLDVLNSGTLSAIEDPGCMVRVRRFNCLQDWSVTLDTIINQVNSDDSVSDILDIQRDKSKIRCEKSKQNAFDHYKNNAQSISQGINESEHERYCDSAVEIYMKEAFGPFLMDYKQELLGLCNDAFEKRFRKCNELCETPGCGHRCSEGRIDHCSSHKCNRLIDRVYCDFKDSHGCMKKKQVFCGEISVPFDCEQHCTESCGEHNNICILSKNHNQSNHQCKQCCNRKCTGGCDRYCIKEKRNHQSAQDHSCGEMKEIQCTYSLDCVRTVRVPCGGYDSHNTAGDYGQCCPSKCMNCSERSCDMGRNHGGSNHICAQCCSGMCTNCGKRICNKNARHDGVHICSMCCAHQCDRGHGKTLCVLGANHSGPHQCPRCCPNKCQNSQCNNRCIIPLPHNDNSCKCGTLRKIRCNCCGSGDTIKLWNKDTGQCIRDFNAHKGGVRAISTK
eukprot:gb/GECH01008992.1/.p1 GENE.gb/GECH01008992.1/~~gb/GECH01008992.1/.p1  ORF type:complete len:569 (+),score=34.66 gb/GECH01008992.1/:1-1707(+)